MVSLSYFSNHWINISCYIKSLICVFVSVNWYILYDIYIYIMCIWKWKEIFMLPSIANYTATLVHSMWLIEYIHNNIWDTLVIKDAWENGRKINTINTVIGPVHKTDSLFKK